MTENDVQPQGGTKFDQGKLPMDLLDPEWLEGVAQILQFGAQKYAAHNWRQGISYSRLYAATQRHLTAFAKGWETDGETGLSHLLHASCCLMFLYSMQQHRRDLNDMYWADTDCPERLEDAFSRLADHYREAFETAKQAEEQNTASGKALTTEDVRKASEYLLGKIFRG